MSETMERNTDGKRYAFYSAQWSKWQKIAIVRIVCSDGRMLKLIINDASKKWTKFYKLAIREWLPVRSSITRGIRRWEQLTIDCTVDTMQDEIDKWQTVGNA